MSNFGVMNGVSVVLCDSPEAATASGHVYRSPTKAVEIEKVVIVRNGTHGGNSTVDIVLKDESGNQYVTMVTGAILAALVKAMNY